MLAASYIFQQGTPFIYQGQEIGMTNIHLMSIDQYVDVSSKTNYYTYHLKEDPERRLHRIHLSSRDSARTPMQWDNTENAGFSTVRPWFYVNKNYKKINVAAEEADEYSILNFYRKCLKLRKESNTLIFGRYKEYFPRDKSLYVYERALGNEVYVIVCSFSRLPVKLRLPDKYPESEGELVLCNYPEDAWKYKSVMQQHKGNLRKEVDEIVEQVQEDVESFELKHGMLRPYEARVYRYVI